MNAMKQYFHNFFHENKSTMNGLLLLILIGISHKFLTLSDEVQAGLDVALSAAAIKFLTGSDSGTPKPPEAV